MPERTIGIMTVLNLEWEAALYAFGLNPKDYQHPVPYASTVIHARNNDQIRVHIGKALMSGTTEHVLPTYRMIQELDPECMILCGIACGLEQLPLCSVVTASSVYAYEYTKTVPGIPIDQDRIAIVPPELRMSMKEFSPTLIEEWHQAFQTTLKKTEPTVAVDNPLLKKNKIIASGNKVIKDGMLEKLHETKPNIWAGEMEAHGFAEACNHDSEAGLRWTVIRGISDHGGLDKIDPELRNTHHFPAALSAATLCRVFLEKAYTPSSHALTTPLRRYMIGKIRSRSLEGIKEFRRRELEDDKMPIDFSDDVKKRLEHPGVRRVVALCGGKDWGPDVVRDYYEICLKWAEKNPLKNIVADKSEKVQKMTRLFYKPEDGFSDWDICVMVQHHLRPGACALTFQRNCLRDGAFESVADDILKERLGFVAFDEGPGLLMGSKWSVILHAGGSTDSHEEFRIAECRKEYAVREMISLLRHLIDRADEFTPTDEQIDEYRDWKNYKNAYDASFPNNCDISDISMGSGVGSSRYGGPADKQRKPG